MKPRQLWRGLLVVWLGWMLASCGIEMNQPSVVSDVPPTVAPTTAAVPAQPDAGTQPARWFALDSLVRSTQIDGLDLHLRYLERTTAGLVVHLAFYNNSSNDLAFVRGVAPADARLIGTSTLAPTAISPSLQAGIGPEGTWLANAANNGTLTFPASSESVLTFELPGFPPIPLRLSAPLQEPPEPSATPEGTFRYAFEVIANDRPDLAIRISAATVTSDALTIELLPITRQNTTIRLSGAVLREAAVFDGRWNQLRALPQPSEPAAGSGAMLRFPRPAVGDTLLLRLPSFPLVRLPLRPNAAAALVTPADLPPTAQPRPTPTPAPSPGPADAEALARTEIYQLLDQITVALSQQDQTSYLAAFSAALRPDQAVWFERVQALPLADVQFSATNSDAAGVFNPARTALNNVLVTLRYNVRDVDPANVFVNELRFSFEYASNWRISAVTGELPFWAYAPTQAQRTTHFWVLFRPEAQAELPKLIEESERAFTQVDAALPGRAPQVSVMFVTATRDEFTNLTDRPGDRFAGVALSRYQVSETGLTITNQAFFINGAAFAEAFEEREQTITHEFTHLVLAPKTMPFAPGWLVEGAAMAVSQDFPRTPLDSWRADHAITDFSLEELTALTNFGQGVDDDQTQLQYAYAAYLARYIITTYGMERFLDLYDSFSLTPPEQIQAALPAEDDDAARTAAFGAFAQRLTKENVETLLEVDLATLEQNFATWLAEQLG